MATLQWFTIGMLIIGFSVNIQTLYKRTAPERAASVPRRQSLLCRLGVHTWSLWSDPVPHGNAFGSIAGRGVQWKACLWCRELRTHDAAMVSMKARNNSRAWIPQIITEEECACPEADAPPRDEPETTL